MAPATTCSQIGLVRRGPAATDATLFQAQEPSVIRNPRAITAASFAAMFFLGVGYSIIGAAARNLGLTPTQIGILLAVQNVGFGVSVAVSGALADTHSKPRILAVGSVITALAFFAFFTHAGTSGSTRWSWCSSASARARSRASRTRCCSTCTSGGPRPSSTSTTSSSPSAPH